MVKFQEIVQEADWKIEKHVPVIDCPDVIKADQLVDITVGIGKEVAHPNTTAHHISWISLYFLPLNEKFPYQLGHYTFLSHGASAKGADTSTVYTHHQVMTSFKSSKAGTLIALAHCNIHGLWESSKKISLE
jgi:superoxide reductase